MADVVPTLEDICVRYIVDNFHSLITNCSSCSKAEFIWRFFYTGCFIASGPAGKILLKLCNRRLIQAEHLNLFSPKYAFLRYPVLPDFTFTVSSLSVLRNFNFFGLAAINLKGVKLSKLISSLSGHTLKNLVVINLSYNSIKKQREVLTETALGRLKNLQSVNVSSTGLTSKCLQSLIKVVPQLTFLNISENRVNNINCLLEVKESLRGLIMCDLEFSDSHLLEEALTTISQLRELRVLDVSGTEFCSKESLPVAACLCPADRLPYLEKFDISGNRFGITLANLIEFIENHPTLKFLGLVDWYTPMGSFSVSDLEIEYPHLTIIGDSGKLLLNTLTKENVSERNIQNVLNSLKKTVLSTNLPPHLLNAVLKSMTMHISNFISTRLGLDLLHESLSRMAPSVRLKDLLTRVVSVVFKCIEEYQQDESTLWDCFSILNLIKTRFEATFGQNRWIELTLRSLQWHCSDLFIVNGLDIVNIMHKELFEAEKEKFIIKSKDLQLMLTWIAKGSYLGNFSEGLFARGSDYSTDYLLGDNDFLDYSELSHYVIEEIIKTLSNLISDCPESCEDFVKLGGVMILSKFIENVSEGRFKEGASWNYFLGTLLALSKVQSTRQNLLTKPLLAFFNRMIMLDDCSLRLRMMEIISNLLYIQDNVWTSQVQQSKADFLQTWDDVLCNCLQTPTERELPDEIFFDRLESLFWDSNKNLEICVWTVLNIHNFMTINILDYLDFMVHCPFLCQFLYDIAFSGKEAVCRFPGIPRKKHENYAKLLQRRAKEIINMKKKLLFKIY